MTFGRPVGTGDISPATRERVICGAGVSAGMKLCALSLLICCWGQHSLAATYSFGRGVDSRQVVEKVAASFLTDYRPRFEIETPRAVGRQSRQLNEEEIASLPSLIAASESREFCLDSTRTFDLWTLAEELRAPSSAAIAIRFSVRQEAPTSRFLLLGFFGSAYLYVDGKAVWGVAGERKFTRGQGLVEVALPAGLSELTLVLVTSEPWKSPPPNHYCSNWCASVEILSNLQTAWDEHWDNTFHLTDTPLVSALGDVRVDAFEGQVVEFFPLDNPASICGRAKADGSVKWSPESRGFRGIGILSIGSSAEPVWILGEQGEEISRLEFGSLAPSDFWRLRLRHLLQWNPETSRDLWWARKAVLSRFQLERETVPEALLNRCKVSGFQCLAAPSRIDGSWQFSLMFLKPGKTMAKSALIILPFVPNPLRPPVESHAAAELYSQEEMVIAASSDTTAFFWPLYVDIDYGREVAQSEIDAALSQISRHPRIGTETARILVGTCSAGVAALRAAAIHNVVVDGVVLYSPIVFPPSNMMYLNSREEGTLRLLTQREEAGKEQLDALADNLKRTNLFIVFDSGMPGHGDPVSTKSLETALRERGSELKVRWLPSVTDWVWGPRLVERYQLWMNWASSLPRRSGSPKLSSPPNEDGELSVKKALMRGFTIDEPSDEPLANWRGRWVSKMANYRGNIPQKNYGAATELRFSRGQQTAPEVIFKIRATRTSNTDLVEVSLTGDPAMQSPPLIDLLADGNFSEAEWALAGKTWRLVTFN